MSIKIVGKNCCACYTCKTVCKFDAISAVTDEYGFEQTVVDTDKCQECGMCEKFCPALHANKFGSRYSCGAAYALDGDVRFQGSSGGLFGIFARHIISQGGIVYGAAFDNELKLKTTAATTNEELVSLYKSKYLLCDTNDSFIEIKAKLEKGINVLYCSSPCQISALKLFLDKSYDNLMTIDFVCHGVGSWTLFNKSIRFSQKKMSIKIKKVIFRYKVKSASSLYYYCYCCEKEKTNFAKTGIYLSFPYYNAYCKQLVCRECCYDCQYATEERVGDITIGDFHNIAKYDSSIDRFAGVSMFICNSTKGEMFFNAVKDELFVEPFEWEVLKLNNRFRNDSNKPKKQHAFMESVATEPFDTTVNKYLKPIKDWKLLVYYKSPIFLRNIVRKFWGRFHEVYERWIK